MYLSEAFPQYKVEVESENPAGSISSRAPSSSNFKTLVPP
jgi:hypothetical protein